MRNERHNFTTIQGQTVESAAMPASGHAILEIMSAKTSVKYIRPTAPASQIPFRLVTLAVVLAMLIVGAGILTFGAANTIMRSEPRQLASFSSNVMPPFQVISFPSLDEQTMLSGWMFPAKGDPVSTVIFVHDQGKDRLQFDVDTPVLYQFFVDQGYNVLSFDLRHAGKSGGTLSAYGFSEWEDVIAAIHYARRFTTTQDVLLFGFGSGVTASLFAWARLPEQTTAVEEPSEGTRSVDVRIQALGIDQSYVRGILLDTPAVSADNYIQAAYRQGGVLDRFLLQHTVPYAVRLSASSTGQRSLVTLLTRMQAPAFIAYSDQDDAVGRRAILPLVNERLRLHPDTTLVFKTQSPGSVASFTADPDAYLAALNDYLTRFIG
jgi:pimeloyl-ACP methyl ester carboxylesterase